MIPVRPLLLLLVGSATAGEAPGDCPEGAETCAAPLADEAALLQARVSHASNLSRAALPFTKLIIKNNCQFPIYLNGAWSNSPANVAWLELAQGKTEEFGGSGPGNVFIPTKLPSHDRIEAALNQNPEFVETTWLEMPPLTATSQGWSFLGGVPHMNFATQTHINEMGMQVELQDAASKPLFGRGYGRAGATFAAAKMQGTVTDCLEATKNDQSAIMTTSKNGHKICLPICPRDPARKLDIWNSARATSCEACASGTHFVPQPGFPNFKGYYVQGTFNGYAQYGSQSSCGLMEDGTWVSQPRTVTDRAFYIRKNGGAREYDPTLKIPDAGKFHGMNQQGGVTFECWDKAGAGSQGWPIGAHHTDFVNLHQMAVTFCPTKTTCTPCCTAPPR